MIGFFLISINNVFAQSETASQYGTLAVEQEVYEIPPGESTQTVKIFGKVEEIQADFRVNIMITTPDGLSEGSKLITTQKGFFETYVLLNENSRRGQYEVFASYESLVIGSVFFNVQDQELSVEELEEARQTIPTEPVVEPEEEVIFLPPIKQPIVESNPYSDSTLFVDKNPYNAGETIYLSGYVKNFKKSGSIVDIDILYPDDYPIIQDRQVADSDTGFWSASYKTGNEFWDTDGKYTINIIYDGYVISNRQFDYSTEPTPTTPQQETTQASSSGSSVFDEPITSAEDFDRRSAACDSYECQQAQMFAKQRYLQETGQYEDPFTQMMRETNERMRVDPQLSFERGLPVWGTIFAIVVGVIVTVVAVKKRSKSPKTAPPIESKRGKWQGIDTEEKEWEGI